ncbi:MAG TPA: hypothetical protein VE575_02775, partial [Acidimicrobiales bacterium]|nr:hypothetical protein [Acidimicrobiales bacterium]
MTAVSGSGSDPPQPRTPPPPPPPPPAPGRAAGVPPPPASHLADPHGLAVAAGRLSAGARRSGRVALAVLAAVLQGDEAVAVVVQGRFRGEIGVA